MYEQKVLALTQTCQIIATHVHCVCKAELSPLLVLRAEVFMAVRMNFVVFLNVTPGGGLIGGWPTFQRNIFLHLQVLVAVRSKA